MKSPAAALLLMAMLMPVPMRAAPISFGIFGDTPYTGWERSQLPKLIDEMGDANLAFIVHIGDIKNGRSACSDGVFRDMLGVFQASRPPLIYVPGDNEWTDCHRQNNGSYDPLERLQKLREMFFTEPYALGQRKLELERQSSRPGFAKYVENVRWEMGGAVFVGLNVPGSDNNIGTVPSRPTAEFVERSRANEIWLRESFAIARARKARGVLIAIQADPEFEADAMGHPNPGYRDFLNQLRAETQAFDGEVVLAHGDTHYERIDKPLADRKTMKPIAKFTRVETYGSPFMGWIRGSVDADDVQFFRFFPQPYTPAGGAD